MRLGGGPALVLLAALLPASGPVRAETGEWFPLHTWGARHGLPETAVRAMLQDRDGYLWIATAAGAVRFDGVRFVVFDDRDGGPLEEIELQAMAQSRDGSIWIASFGGGITRFLDGRFTTFTTAQGLGGDFVTSLLAQPDGAVWAGTDGGLSRWKDGQLRTFTTRDGLPENQTHPLASDPDGSLWLTTRSGGLFRYGGGKTSRASVPGLPEVGGVRTMLRDRRGVAWVGTSHGLIQLQDGQTRRYAQPDGLAGNRVHALAEDLEGNLWIGTDSGLSRYRDGVLETQAVPEYAGRGITALTASREGGVFAASGWVAYLRRRQFRHHDKEQGLPHPMATTFFEDSQKTLWIGTVGGLASLRDGKITAHSPDSFPTRIVGGIIEDRAGHVWVGSDAGLYRSRAPVAQGPPVFVRVPDQPARTIETRVMFVDRDGVLWIGAVNEGLVRYRDGAFTVFTTEDGLLHNAVRGIQQDAGGALWLGTRKGLNRLQDGKFTGFTSRHGLAHDTVESLFLDSEGTLWVGTRRGVTRYKDGRFSTLTVDHGLLASYVNSFVEDAEKHLWMVSVRGVFRASLQRLNAVADGRAKLVGGLAFGVEHGLPSARASAGYDRTVYRTRDGRIWAGTVRGMAVIEPGARPVVAAPPPVRIEEVQADGRTLPDTTAAVAPPGRGDLSIRYTGLSFVAPDKVRFRYQLEGHDPRWVDAEHRRMAFYSNLPPGRYQFRVQAASVDGGWSPAAAVSVVLRPSWTQTWLFRIGALVAALLLAAGVYGNHVRQLKRRQRQLEQAVAERTAELAAANKELETFSYSVSHDLRAPLRSIEGFGRALLEGHAGSLSPEGQTFLNHMRQASERMDSLIEDMLRLARVGSTEMHRHTVDLSALATDIARTLARQQPGREVEVVVPAGLMASADPSLMRIVLENLLGNAWKFTAKRPQARIELGEATASSGTSTFFVRDNGAGFDPGYAHKLFNAFQRLHAASEFEGHGVGLTTVRRIIQRHGGKVWAEARPGEGATFYFTLPESPGNPGAPAA